MVFEALKIDNTLEAAEKTAIDNLKIDDKNTADVFKTALKNEKIAGVDQSFLDIATAFSKYKVEFSVNKGTTTSETIAKCDDTAPQRLKNLIADKDSNDFVYLTYKVSVLLKVGEEKDLEKETFGLKTTEQLKNLKAEIEKTTTPETGDTETLEAKDITFTLYSGVTQDQVVAAGEKLKTVDTTLAKKIIPLLKSGDVKGVQEALGMTSGASELYKKADGLFGARTLANLETGKMIEPKETGTGETTENVNLKDYTITMYGKPYTFKLNDTTITNLDYLKSTYGFEKVFWDIKGSFDSNAKGNLSNFPLKYYFVESIKNYFEKDEWKKEKNMKGEAYTTIEEYINEMALDDIVAILNKKDVPVTQPSTEKPKEKPVEIQPRTEKINEKVFETYIKQLKENFVIKDYLTNIEKEDADNQKRIKERVGITGAKTIGIEIFGSELNPNIGLQIDKPDGYYAFSGAIEFNFAEFTKENPNQKGEYAIDIEAFYKNINKKIIDMVKEEEKKDKAIKEQNEKDSNLSKLITSIRGKKFTLTELFPKLTEFQKAKYQAFFDTFDESKLEIHNDNYTRLDGNDLLFDLDQTGKDKEFVEKIKFGIADIADDKGNLDENKFKSKLTEKIIEIIGEHYST